MKIVGIIPARYKSSRFEGKPLADICGKPMVWWVYQQAVKVRELDAVYVATDDRRIEAACKELDINVLMTSERHLTSTDRVAEVSEKISADLYVEIMGDEPLIESSAIAAILHKVENIPDFYVANLTSKMTDPTEVVDFTNLKCVSTKSGYALYISRSPIPYPKGTLDFEYYKMLGICCFTKPALDFYASNERGILERAEDNDFFRFLENDKKVKLIPAECKMLSVDTPKDLDRVRKIIMERIK